MPDFVCTETEQGCCARPGDKHMRRCRQDLQARKQIHLPFSRRALWNKAPLPALSCHPHTVTQVGSTTTREPTHSPPAHAPSAVAGRTAGRCGCRAAFEGWCQNTSTGVLGPSAFTFGRQPRVAGPFAPGHAPRPGSLGPGLACALPGARAAMCTRTTTTRTPRFPIHLRSRHEPSHRSTSKTPRENTKLQNRCRERSRTADPARLPPHGLFRMAGLKVCRAGTAAENSKAGSRISRSRTESRRRMASAHGGYWAKLGMEASSPYYELL